MSKTYDLEPIVDCVLREFPDTRGDNFLLCVYVWNKFTDTTQALDHIFVNHKEFGIPSFESITRCRRKLQERDPSLRPDWRTREARKAEEAEMVDYALSDKQWY